MPTSQELEAAVAVLTAAGAKVILPPPRLRLMTLAAVAEALAVSERWVRDNLNEFPGAVDLGSTRRVLRIPEADVKALLERRRCFHK